MLCLLLRTEHERACISLSLHFLSTKRDAAMLLWLCGRDTMLPIVGRKGYFNKFGSESLESS